MRDTKLLDSFKKRIEREFKEKNLFKNLRKEVEIGANGTQQYIIKKGINTGKVATKWNDNTTQLWLLYLVQFF